MARHDDLFNAISSGDRKTVDTIVQGLVGEGVDVVALLNDTMIPAMRDVGEKFSRNEVYVPELLVAARAMQTGLTIIEPLLTESGHKPIAKVCVGTVKGDLHDIGKNLVAMMVKGAGYEVDDLGVDCDIDKFKDAVSNGAQAVLCSALLTTTMPYMESVVEAFKDQSDVKVFIGGAPITEDYCKQIGASGFGEDANDAVNLLDAVFSSA